ncbi:MAG: hypothetical protein IKZ12_05890 [Alistipes sp.]|nr:hypothetical protein [Alistipes sp.]
MMKQWSLLAALLLVCGVATAQEQMHKVENVVLKGLDGSQCSLPMFGEKNLIIFYVDPDRHKQNEAFTYEMEEHHLAEGEEIVGFGVLNLKDSMLPNVLVRTIARKRTEKNGATVLVDDNRTLSTAWGLGDCNNLFTLILVSKEGEISFLGKGELTEEQQKAFYKALDQYR